MKFVWRSKAVKGEVGNRMPALALALFAALGFAAGLGAVACSSDDHSRGSGTAEPPDDLGKKEIPDQEITSFVLRQIDEEGRSEWLLRAVTARVYEARDEVEADKIQIDFYDPAGAVNSVLTADLGVITRRTNDMRALGNVKVTNREEHELTTEELNYSTQRRQIYTDKFVRIVRGRDILTGYGLATDPNLAGEFEIQRDVQATVRELPQADAGGGEADGNRNP
jgi:LPS export ABC transporter protein LptC